MLLLLLLLLLLLFGSGDVPEGLVGFGDSWRHFGMSGRRKKEMIHLFSDTMECIPHSRRGIIPHSKEVSIE
jgi:Sec-independent protein translocase protein TatA